MRNSRAQIFSLVAVISLLLVVSGCRTLGLRAFAQPVVTFQDVKIAQISPVGGTLDVLIGVKNPNGYRLDATRMSYRLMTDSTELGRGVIEKAISIRAGDSTVVTLPLNFTFAALGVVARLLQSRGAVEYRIVGDLSVATPVGSFTHPYDQKGYFHNPWINEQQRGSRISRQLISLQPPIERAVLVAAPLKRGSDDKQTVDAHLDELAELADTAGALVVGTLTQRMDRINPATYLGSGKVEELSSLISDSKASIVVFDDELSPAQGKNLEDAVGTRVVDRAELILDIFAIRARSAEARMQVELAQLEYSLPRLTRMWTHLEKFRGGIGVRGPGETQLETDRRLINKRIKLLKQRLDEVKKARAVQRSGRKLMFRAALVGYTNAGKSSILRALSRSDDVFVEDRLFATIDPLSREVDVGGQHAVITDTVGFIRKLPHHLVASFRATLEEVLEADLLLHVIDASFPDWESQVQVVDAVLADIGVHDKPVIHVFNKIDLLSGDVEAALRQRLPESFPNSVFVSALRSGNGNGPDGLDPLRSAIGGIMRSSRPVREVRIPISDGRLLAELYRDAEIIGRRTDGDELVVTVRMDEALAGRLRTMGYTMVAQGIEPRTSGM